MQLLFSLEINKNRYDIYSTDVINDDKDIMGYTVFTENLVYIKNMKSKEQMLRTLKHELMHIWLYEFGHNQHDENKTFNYEDICEIVACSNDFINENVQKYKEKFT